MIAPTPIDQGAYADLILKYGGTSVRQGMQHIVNRVRDDPRIRAMVVSAPGRPTKESPKSEGQTNQLVAVAEEQGNESAQSNLMDKILDTYAQMGAPSSMIDEFASDLRQRIQSDTRGPVYLDNLTSFGEHASPQFQVYALEQAGIHAVYVPPPLLWRYTDTYSDAWPLAESKEMIGKFFADKFLSRERIVYVTGGFWSTTRHGTRATLGRGGSDLSQGHLGASIQEAPWYSETGRRLLLPNCTDEDGIRAADPNLIKDARRIRVMNYWEARIAAYAGFGILHSMAMIPAALADVPFLIQNTFDPQSQGTWIVANREVQPDERATAIVYKPGKYSFNCEQLGLHDLVGIGRKILQVFEQHGLVFDHYPGGIDDVTVIAGDKRLSNESFRRRISGDLSEVLREHALFSEFGQGNGAAYQNVNIGTGHGYIVLAGAALKGIAGQRMSARMLDLTADYNIPVPFHERGEQQRCIIFGVPEDRGAEATRLMYDAVFR
jgi:aspartate kinase